MGMFAALKKESLNLFSRNGKIEGKMKKLSETLPVRRDNCEAESLICCGFVACYSELN